MKKKRCTWKRQTKENVVSSSFVLLQCIPCSPAWQFCTNNYFSHAKCASWVFSSFTLLLLTCWGNCSPAFIQKWHKLWSPPPIFFTHLQISSRADFWYSLCHKHLGNFAFDSDTNSVTNENPHLELKSLPPQNRILIPFRILSLCHGQN